MNHHEVPWAIEIVAKGYISKKKSKNTDVSGLVYSAIGILVLIRLFCSQYDCTVKLMADLFQKW